MPERLTRQEQRERNQRRLLEAAEKVFAERGIQGASLDEVAAEAGLTKGAVYSNFASKEDLVLAVMSDRMREEGRAQAERLRCSAPGEPLVDDFGRHWAETVRSGQRERCARVALEFLIHATRRPDAREELLALAFPPTGDEPHPLAPPGSELAQLPAEHAGTILAALDIGMRVLSLLDPERFPPELFPVALRLLAGMEVDVSGLPPVAERSPGPG